MYQYDRNYIREGNAWPNKYVCILEDKVKEVLTEEQFQSRLSTYTEYINNFVRVKLVRKDLAF